MMAPDTMGGTPLALYIHWPFCLSKCPYCDFNSHVRDVIPEKRIIEALRREMAHEATRLGRRQLGSIFFGGGTPSLMSPESVAALIDDAMTLFPPAPDAPPIEITLEANPTSVEAAKLRGFAEAGVNRVSLGVQALEDEALAMLGRHHSARQAIAALETGRAIFPRVTFDLIYARPGQTIAAWREELGTALSLVADHVSLYQLTIEPGTRFEALHRQGLLVLPDDELSAALYAETAEIAAQHGLAAYEISNYARPGAESRHNLTYWRYGDYLGIGPGAHGRMTLGDALFATRRHRAPEPWAERVEASGSGLTEEVALTQLEQVREMLLMGLRLSEGVEAGRFEARTSMKLVAALDATILEQALEADYLIWRGTALQATAEGRLRLEALLPALVL